MFVRALAISLTLVVACSDSSNPSGACVLQSSVVPCEAGAPCLVTRMTAIEGCAATDGMQPDRLAAGTNGTSFLYGTLPAGPERAQAVLTLRRDGSVTRDEPLAGILGGVVQDDRLTLLGLTPDERPLPRFGPPPHALARHEGKGWALTPLTFDDSPPFANIGLGPSLRSTIVDGAGTLYAIMTGAQYDAIVAVSPTGAVSSRRITEYEGALRVTDVFVDARGEIRALYDTCVRDQCGLFVGVLGVDGTERMVAPRPTRPWAGAATFRPEPERLIVVRAVPNEAGSPERELAILENGELTTLPLAAGLRPTSCTCDSDTSNGKRCRRLGAVANGFQLVTTADGSSWIVYFVEDADEVVSTCGETYCGTSAYACPPPVVYSGGIRRTLVVAQVDRAGVAERARLALDPALFPPPIVAIDLASNGSTVQALLKVGPPDALIPIRLEIETSAASP